MRKHLPLALATATIVASTGCDREPIIRADDVELIHVDTHAVKINVTVSAADGQRSTIVLSPLAALELQAELGRTLAMVVEGAEALRAQQRSPAPAP